MGIPSLSFVQKAQSDNRGDWGQISRVESMVGAVGGSGSGQGFPGKPGLQRGTLEIKAISNSRNLHRNSLHFGQGSSFPEKLDQPVSGGSKCLLVHICG